ncbi:GH25 family lysozyme [Paludicola sp. MB14-C6]|uniref:GH25 family lysozyme n=1 Tax=Paludihabitans sp. MB14-C6 TaxID=3070656 RepID=UPI0027DCF035|nr:GH25 family lysozyme [Paludicola sp. MB14-C6]WMJ24055.1 GH25 family lysozyme [Paludicola sp. MB14-C6]
MSKLVINGIDVSKYQGQINWNTVSNSGVKFAMIRAGWCGYDGNIKEDEYYRTNMEGAIQAGLNVGVYVYSYAKTVDAAAIAARQTLELVKPYKVTYPIAFDVEDEIYTKYKPQDNNALVIAFLDAIERAGYYGIVYTYTYFAQTHLDMKNLKRFDMWIADYRGYVGYKGAYGMWQYSAKGKIDGIGADVDLNMAYNDYPKIIQTAGLNNIPKVDLSVVNYKKYTIQKGDSFWSIAKSQMGNGLYFWKVAQANGLKVNSVIYPGQIIKIPNK